MSSLKRSQALALADFIQRKLRVIEKLFRVLEIPSLKGASRDELIVVIYRLQNLYTAFESIFERVSGDFRHLVSVPRRSLLERMRMDLSPVRPAVLDDEAFARLEALARFRYRSRQEYDHPPKAQDVEPVLRKALELREIYRPQMETFVEILRRVR